MCGIFGIITQRPKRFDFPTFCTLGCHNDSRGGDSCGIFIDGKYEYGVGNNKLFSDFMIPGEGASNLIHETEECTISLGHCRKASVGSISEKTAQPVVIEEDGVVKFVLMHNGTIHNHKELATKYIPNIDVTGLTDSQILANIIYLNGFDVLGEYIGSAALCVVDYREEKPRIFFWTGYSKEYSTSAKASCERPLHFAKSKHELVFSSEDIFLRALRPNAEILYPNANVLLEFVDNKFIRIQEFPQRADMHRSSYTSSYYGGYGYYNYGTGCSSNTTKYTPINSHANNNSNKNTNVDLGFVNFDFTTLSVKHNNKVCHGKFYINNFGRILNEKTNINGAEEMYFWSGILLKNRECFMKLNEFAEDINVSPLELMDLLPEFVLYLSPYPYRKIDGKVFVIDNIMNFVPYTGCAIYPFAQQKYIYKDGTYSSNLPYTQSESLSLFREHRNDVINLDDLVKYL